jgi:hypothetical protein
MVIYIGIKSIKIKIKSKLNYDGACRELGATAGCGGLFRDLDAR